MFYFYLNVDLLLIIKIIKFEVCLNFCRYVYVNINIDSKSIYIYLLEIFVLMMIENVLCSNFRLL